MYLMSAAMTRQQAGRRAETAAAAWLDAQGMDVVARNVHTPMGEIDLVARDHEGLRLVEVRSRQSQRFGTPEESLTRGKLERFQRAGLWYLQQRGWREDDPVSFDVIAVRWSAAGQPQCEHLQDVFADG
jgi:putative endonuclease